MADRDLEFLPVAADAAQRDVAEPWRAVSSSLYSRCWCSASMRDVWVITRRASGLPRPADRRRRRVACRDGRDTRVEKARQHRGSTVSDGNSLVEVAHPLGVVRAARWGARRGEFMAARSVPPRMRARDRPAADRRPLLSNRRRRVMLAAHHPPARLTPLRPWQRGSATPRSRCLTSMPRCRRARARRWRSTPPACSAGGWY